MRVLLVAYACEPGRGSESEVGWRWAIAAAAAGHDVTVLTRLNNRTKIEDRSEDFEGLSLRFEYHEAPALFLFLKKLMTLPRLYYVAWQLSLLAAVRRYIQEGAFDRYHQLTYVSARFPSVLACAGDRFVWGPIGGLGRVPPSLRSELRLTDRVLEMIRDTMAHVDRWNPLWLWTARESGRVLVADRDTLLRLPVTVRVKARLAPAVGIDLAPVQEARRCEGRTILMVGGLTARKGQALALRALATLMDVEWTCDIIGVGPDRARLERLVNRLGIGSRVHFLGGLPRERVLAALAAQPIFVALSFRDSGGMALLEAASVGCPLVYLSVGAPAQLFGESDMGAVAVSESGAVVRDAAQWIRKYLGDADTCKLAGERALAVAESVSWGTKAKALEWLYACPAKD